MKVEIGDKVVVGLLEGEVTFVHESGAVDIKLSDGRMTYALSGNFAEAVEIKTPAPVQKLKYTTITR
jgi:hypothetical protein